MMHRLRDLFGRTLLKAAGLNFIPSWFQSAWTDLAYAEHQFATVEEVFGRDHLPDSVCAMALAWMGVSHTVEVTWL